MLPTKKFQLGSVKVYTSDEGGHKPEYFVDKCMSKIISISDTSPFAEQSKAFKEAIEKTVHFYMIEAIKADRQTICKRLEKAGKLEEADLIRRL
jgi:hypothetical protein